jgi:hypothetical protein
MNAKDDAGTKRPEQVGGRQGRLSRLRLWLSPQDRRGNQRDGEPDRERLNESVIAALKSGFSYDSLSFFISSIFAWTLPHSRPKLKLGASPPHWRCICP